MDVASELITLAEGKFGKLTVAEKKLFRAAAKGEMADYSSRSKKPIGPAKAAKWGPSRVLLAGRIAWLCTDKQAEKLVTHRGIRITGARIDEEFDLEAAKVAFPLYFEQCKFTADINLRHTQVAALYMIGTYVGRIFADALKSNGNVSLRDGFKAEGEVRLLGARVNGNLECDNSQFINLGGKALSADGLNVVGSILLRNGFKAQGEVGLREAAVGGGLECDNGQFTNQGGKALSADGIKVDGPVFLCDGFKVQGEVRLIGATVGGDLNCENAQFTNEKGDALLADGLKVDGSVFLRNGFKAQGAVSFFGAKIRGYLGLTGVDSTEEMILDLRSAKIGTLYSDQESWPAPGQLSLRGLEYAEISHESPIDSQSYIEWLRRQDGFSPQPYEQLAKVLRESGDGAGARDVLVAKNKDKADRTKLTRAEWFWYRFFGPLIGYGHRPWLVIPLALVIILFGSVFFKEGYSDGLVTPPSDSAYAKEGDAGVPAPGDTNRRISDVYPVFNSLVYSTDVCVQVVDLRQVKYWLPNANRGSELVPTSSAALCTGGLLLFWLWLEIACGCVLTILFLVGLTGLVRT